MVKKNKNTTPGTAETTLLEIDSQVLKVISKIIENALTYEEITGTRKIGITGEVGEIFACYHLGLKLCKDPRARGFDAIDRNGKKVQIKTRRSKSAGLPKKAGRVGRFSTHRFDYTLLVLLNRDYRVAEIWKSSYRDLKPLIEKQKRTGPNLASFKKVARRIWRS